MLSSRIGCIAASINAFSSSGVMSSQFRVGVRRGRVGCVDGGRVDRRICVVERRFFAMRGLVVVVVGGTSPRNLKVFRDRHRSVCCYFAVAVVRCICDLPVALCIRDLAVALHRKSSSPEKETDLETQCGTEASYWMNPSCKWV